MTQRLDSICDRIGQVFGPKRLTELRSVYGQMYYTNWATIHPLPHMLYQIRDSSYQLNEIKVELIELNTDWVELADWFAAINHQQLPTGEPSP